MELKQISKRIVIAGTLLIWTIKLFIRPYYQFDQPLHFFLGIAPNFLGSFLLPFGACWFFSGRNHLLARLFRLEGTGDLRQFCLLGFGLLVVNEYLQLIPVFGRTFDYFDIVFSSIGLLLSYFVYGRLQEKVQLV
ncbi:MAG: hypothetical protein HZA79_15505 [Sphingobacteriales bacterium]|nr:hypothetical protein [Sphingobacteriales bacterium]